MIVFWLICTGLVAIALAFVLPPLFERAPQGTSDNEKREANLDIYRDQLSELEADLRNGIISQEQHQQDRDEIERRLLDDVATPASEIAKPLASASLKRWGQALLILGLCSFFLPLLGMQFRVINLLENAQPTVGILVLALGAFLLLIRSNRGAIYAVALGLPILAVSIYLKTGDLRAMNPTGPAIEAGGITQQGIEANVAMLAKRLEQNPNDAEGWVMLARSYMTLEKYGEATNAYGKAVTLKTSDADLLADYAFAMAMTNNRQLQGEPSDLIKKALQIDPENAKALDLAGSAEFQAKHYKQAVDYWQKVLQKTTADSELAGRLSQKIDEAKTLAGTSAK